jgi:hypothetical protein
MGSLWKLEALPLRPSLRRRPAAPRNCHANRSRRQGTRGLEFITIAMRIKSDRLRACSFSLRKLFGRRIADRAIAGRAVKQSRAERILEA